MRQAGLVFLLVFAFRSQAPAQSVAGMSRSVPRGTRSFYGTDFGNRYQYFGLGYGYAPGSFGPGGWSAFGGGGGYGYGGYGNGRSRYGRYGGYGGYGGYGMYDQQEMLHERQMMWSMNFAPMPQTAPNVTVNPYWNPYQSRLGDDIYRRKQPPTSPKHYTNPFVHEQH